MAAASNQRPTSVQRAQPSLRSLLPWSFFSVSLFLLACGGKEPADRPSAIATAQAPAADEAASFARGGAPAEERTARPLVVFLGDSLTAGFGLGEEQAFPALAGELLAARGLAIEVINGGISGDTSAGALERLDWLLTRRPDVLVLAIGANDGLRGQPLEATEANVRQIVRRARAAGAEVLLAGQRIPTNYGPAYAEGFTALYPRVAREEGATLLPFLLEGVAMRPELNLPDGIHPNPAGQRIVAATVADALEPLLEARRAGQEKPAA